MTTRIGALVAVLLIAVSCSGGAPTGDPLLGKKITIDGATILGEPSGRAVSLDSLTPGGARILLNFWASWCLPCRDEIPLLAAYAATSTPAKGVHARVVGVLYRDEAGPGAAAANDLGATWPTLLDPAGAIAAQVPVNAAPLTLLLDSNGVVLDYRVGPFASLVEIEEFVTAP